MTNSESFQSSGSRRWRRWLITAGVLLLIPFAAIFAIPWALSSSWARDIVVETSNEELEGRVSVDDVDFGWLSGVTLHNVEFESHDHSDLAVARFHAKEVQASFAWRKLFDQQVIGRLNIRGAEVAVDRSRLETETSDDPRRPRPDSPHSSPKQPDDADPWTVDLRLTLENSRILVFDGQPDRVVLSGVFDGTGELVPDANELGFRGQLRARDLRVFDEWIPSGIPLPSDLQLQTNAHWRAGSNTFAVPDLQLDWGPHQLRGEWLASSPERFETKVQLDLASELISTLASEYVPRIGIDGGLGLQMQGSGNLDNLERRSWESLIADASLLLPAVTWADHQVSEPRLSLQLAKGSASFQIVPGSATLQGLDLGGAYHVANGTADLRMRWDRSKVGGSLTPALQYVVPLLAGLRARGLEELSQLDFLGEMALDLELHGPASWQPGQTLLGLLEHWKGAGSVEVSDGEFSPSPVFARLLELLDEEKRLSFSKISSHFQIAEGAIHGPDIQLRHKKTPLALRGTTRLTGEIDYELDLSTLLAGRRDGEKILRLLGDRPLTAGISGTVFQPKLQLADILQGSLQSVTDGLLDRAQEDPRGVVEDLLDIFGKKKRKKD